MIRYRFAIGAAGILGLGAIIASTKVLGEAGKGKKEQDIRSTGLMQPIHQDRQFEMKFSECRFTGHPLVTYKTQKTRHTLRCNCNRNCKQMPVCPGIYCY